ncbi:wsv187 [White spot syndrome virus]|uniref:Wsv187 n=4 Tax=White spot syndrome virus TaxID=342409 RepID=Q8VB17_WSSVS|nr:wsv187 [Shrimp white spot syndrome virus]AFX59564.1 wsv187 [White spot syndrome virus]AAL33191.1 wsv187 [Shrimp white spot syndrome virus]AAL89110.1 WSSV242 [Shrimp white spot syndrome virus]AWQ60362.1 wsv187 [Shrimp white spot syndrome virus]AWQ60775.1 wsv187 [Shrimp white spot syndrome virus]
MGRDTKRLGFSLVSKCLDVSTCIMSFLVNLSNTSWAILFSSSVLYSDLISSATWLACSIFRPATVNSLIDSISGVVGIIGVIMEVDGRTDDEGMMLWCEKWPYLYSCG